jgi:hypothetical protein
MIAELLLAGAMAIGGRTEEGRPLRVEADGARVTRVKGSVLAYECADFGDVGPVRFDVRVRARVDRRGRFSVVVGERAERVGVAGYLRDRGRLVTGRVRMTGTIATGQRCESETVRFRLRRAR